VTEPVKVQVQKRALRVLLFAGRRDAEYQFLRTISLREMTEKRMEMSIHNQSIVGEPHVRSRCAPSACWKISEQARPQRSEQQFMSLNDYDVIVAFDPDWTRLSKSQLTNLAKWVDEHSGGVISSRVGLARTKVRTPGGYDLSALIKIYPVVLQDARVTGSAGRWPMTPRAPIVHFSAAAKSYEFMKAR